MSQISRPFQIGLVLVSVLGIAWFLLLRGHGPAPTAPAPVPSPAATATATAPSAISKPHAAVHASKSESRKLAQAAAARTRAARADGKPSVPAKHVAPSPAVQVKNELARGDVVVLLFWNPDSAADQEVAGQVDQVAKEFAHVDVHTALASQVTEYGTVTADLSVLDTPTVEVISPNGTDMTLGAPTDTMIIGETIAQARRNYGPPAVQKLSSDAPGTARARYIAAANRVCAGVTFTDAGLFNVLNIPVPLNTATLRLAAIARLPLPAQDRAFLSSELQTAAAGLTELHDAVALPRYSPAQRADILEWYADVDQASDALASYGLTGCFAYAADQPQS